MMGLMMIGILMLLMTLICFLVCWLPEVAHSVETPMQRRRRYIDMYKKSIRDFEDAKARGETEVIAYYPDGFYLTKLPVDVAIENAERALANVSRARFNFISY